MEKLKQCSWIDEDEDEKCDEETDQICLCCAMPLCGFHQRNGRCPFGGLGFIEV